MSDGPEPDEQTSIDGGGAGEETEPAWQWTLYACWIAQLMSIIGFSFVMPFMPLYVRELGVVGIAQVALWSGLVITASGLTQALMAPVWGALADRYGRKIMVQRAMFGGAVVLTAMAFAGNIWHLLALRALQGCLTGTNVASTTLVASITPNGRLGYSLGMMQVAVLMGITIGPLFGGLMADAWGYRIPFIGAGLLLLIGGIIVRYLTHENFCPPDRETAQNHGLQRAFGRKGVIALMGAFLMLSLSASFVGPIFPLLVEQISGTARVASTAGLLLAISGFAAGLSALAIGLLGDRVGHKLILVTCTVGSAIFSAPHAIAQSVGQLAILRLGMGITRGGTMPSLNAIVAQAVSADTYGRAFGNTRVAGALGMAIGPMMGGFAAAHLGLRWPFVIMSGLLVLSAILIAVWVRPTINGAQEQPSGETEGGDSEAAT